MPEENLDETDAQPVPSNAVSGMYTEPPDEGPLDPAAELQTLGDFTFVQDQNKCAD